VKGAYHGKTGGFQPGCASLHNCMTGHGPDTASYDKAVNADGKPEFLANTMAVMVETQLVVRPTKYALESQWLQPDYLESWQGLKKNFHQ
jgi:homogentisate 1,2-dioxygenase